MESGLRMSHKILGGGTTQEINRTFHPGLDYTYSYFKPDDVPEGWAKVVLVDTESLIPSGV